MADIEISLQESSKHDSDISLNDSDVGGVQSVHSDRGATTDPPQRKGGIEEVIEDHPQAAPAEPRKGGIEQVQDENIVIYGTKSKIKKIMIGLLIVLSLFGCGVVVVTMIPSGAETTIVDSASASNTTDTAFDSATVNSTTDGSATVNSTTDDSASASASNTSGYYSGLHEWTCGNMTFPLIIDGSSVKFFMKVFSPREIAQLKTLNGMSEISTYQIF